MTGRQRKPRLGSSPILGRLKPEASELFAALADEESVALVALVDLRADRAVDLASDDVAGLPGGAELVLGEGAPEEYSVDELGVSARIGIAAGGRVGFSSSADCSCSSCVAPSVVGPRHVNRSVVNDRGGADERRDAIDESEEVWICGGEGDAGLDCFAHDLLQLLGL